MAKIFLIALLSFQSTPVELQKIEASLKTGNAKELVKYFNETVELKIDGESANYSKNQSEVVLRKFFQKNPARGFFYVHNGSSKEGLKYAIGQYTTSGGTYRIVLFLKKQEETYSIYTMRITKDETLKSDGR